MAHTVKSFTQDLDRLSDMVREMGGLVDGQLDRAVQALADRDSDIATDVASRDGRVDEMESGIREYAVRLLACRQPMARDLRFVITAMSIATDLERFGDLVKDIAERTIEVNKAQPMEVASAMPDLGRLARQMSKEVIDAFAAADAAKARAVRDRDGELDALYAEVFRDSLAYMIFLMEDPRDIAACTHLLFIGKDIEEMGNLAAHIAESVVFSVEGGTLGRVQPGHMPGSGGRVRDGVRGNV